MACAAVVQLMLRHLTRHMNSSARCMGLHHFVGSLFPSATAPRCIRQHRRACSIWTPWQRTVGDDFSKCELAIGTLYTKRQTFSSSSRFSARTRVGDSAHEAASRREFSRGGLADFRDTLDAMVTESIGEDDMRGGEDEDDALAVSQSGRLLLFPWKKWTGMPSSMGDGATERVPKAKHPSVTTILQKTMSPDSALALLRWEKYMIKKMGLTAFQKLKQEMFAEGRQLHECIGSMLLSRHEDLCVGAEITGYWESIKDRLPELASDSPLLECHTTHPFLGYHGYADCVTYYQGEPCVVEFKTSRKPKETLSKCFDHPLQVAAYLGALNFDPKHKLKIEKALLVIAYQDGSPASLHALDSALCDAYWRKWLRRLQEYRDWERRRDSARAEN